MILARQWQSPPDPQSCDSPLGDQAGDLVPDHPWGDIRGMGNRLRHAYDRVSLDIVRNTARERVPASQPTPGGRWSGCGRSETGSADLGDNAPPVIQQVRTSGVTSPRAAQLDFPMSQFDRT